MSSDGENAKNKDLEVNDAKSEDAADGAAKTEADAKDAKVESKDENKEATEGDDDKKKDKKEVNDKKDEKKDKDETKKEVEKKEDKKEDVKKNDVSKDESDSEKEEEDEEDDKNDVEDEDDEDEKVDKKEKKKPQKADKVDDEDKDGKTEIPEGSGTELGEIPRIDASISRFKNDDLKLLHRLLFKTTGKTAQIKKNIRLFNGFGFESDSDEYKKKQATLEKFELKQLRIICEMLDLEKKGSKDDISGRVLEFLMEPKDTGSAVGRGRPKRTAAVRANNRGYSSHDESYSSDDRPTPRGRRNMGKRANLKDETSSESDEDFKPSDASDDEKPAKRKRVARKKKDDSEDEVSGADSGSSDDSDAKGKKKKVANNKPAPKTPAATPGRRGRKPAAAKAAPTPAKKTPAKRGRKPAESSEDSGDARENENDGSSSEDEPLSKKAAKSPPTDEEIKTYVKGILEGADLELITMKTVCKQVYAHYPEFDLTHKKDYIKTTVKSLIST